MRCQPMRRQSIDHMVQAFIALSRDVRDLQVRQQRRDIIDDRRRGP